MRASTSVGECVLRRAEAIWTDPSGVSSVGRLAATALAGGALNKAALDAVAPKKGERLIEIGCGPGLGLREALRRVGPDGFVAGVDSSYPATHVASHTVHRAIRQGRATVMRAEPVDLPFRDAFFDRAVAVATYQVWPDPARALREIARILAPRGRLALSLRGAGLERIGPATALLKTQGWRMIDERSRIEGRSVLSVTILAERPQERSADRA